MLDRNADRPQTAVSAKRSLMPAAACTHDRGKTSTSMTVAIQHEVPVTEKGLAAGHGYRPRSNTCPVL